ncbi:MAG TPA: hypothetical protein VFK09_09980 [Gemmatimonadales bacterium]|nr:hypothetical protein [Gemmatimonadales bacterium]
MAADPLAAYLNDHLAGSVAALELIDSVSERERGSSRALFLGTIRDAVETDQRVLRDLIARTGGGESVVKRAAAWVGEKAARAKLAVTGAGDGELAVFEGLEALALGIQGKASLWRALRAAAPGDRRLAGLDFDELEQRAIRQFEAVDSERLALAERVLRGPA